MRTQIVCAEAMPGNPELLREFSQSLNPPILGQFLTQIVEKMQLAGEAGSLLKIEEKIAERVHDAKVQWQRGPVAEQVLLFEDSAKLVQESFRFDQTGITDDQFWQTAERNIYEALRKYAERAEGRYSQRLFADDAAHGFAFIDLCRKRFDTVVMNPPFGDRPVRADQLLLDAFPITAADMYSMFFERAIELVENGGKVGAISNRTWLGLPSFEGLRADIFGASGAVECAADLGSFVLEAQVETAAVIIGKCTNPNALALWVRLLKTKEKESILRQALAESAAGSRHRNVYVSSQRRFSLMPSCVFGYWMSDRLISVYRPENSIEAKAATVKVGTQTSDDFRFVRLAWEVSPQTIGMSQKWTRFAKGGEFSPFYDDIHLVLNWGDGGQEVIAWGKGRPQNSQFFGLVGVTWPSRTTSAFSPRPLPAGCAFGHKGPAAFPIDTIAPATLLGVLASRPARLLLSVRLGAGDDAPGSASKSYEVGLVGDLPFPNFDKEQQEELTSLSTRCSIVAMSDYILDDETSAQFLAPSFFRGDRGLASLYALAMLAVSDREDRFSELSVLTGRIDSLVTEGLKLSSEDRQVMYEELEVPLDCIARKSIIDEKLFTQAYLTKSEVRSDTLPGGVDAELDVRVLTRRKKQTATLRDEETICRLFDIPSDQFVSLRRKLGLLRREDVEQTAKQLVSYTVGAAFGRFDLRIALRDLEALAPSPYDRLPCCSAGMLQNDRGLPLIQDDLRRLQAVGDWNYPIELPLNGVLVDDQGHQFDIEARLRKAFDVIWKDGAEAIEQEACDILGFKSLRDYFRKPTGFFEDHLRRYSKSRRQAPIYWQLCTRSCSYALWVYYPRLTPQTLHACLADFLGPKLKNVSDQVRDLRQTNGSETKLGELLEFEDELKEMRTEIEHLIKLPYEPNLNDGVLIIASPLWKLFRSPKWQRDLKACWQELEGGDYDWAHLAYSIWPDRVKEKCKTDRSIAIAHGLEHLCSIEAPRPKTKRSRHKEDTLIEEDTL